MMIKIGKAEKRSGAWILESFFGIKNFAIRGKHYATVCVMKQKNFNVHLCLLHGDVFVEIRQKPTH